MTGHMPLRLSVRTGDQIDKQSQASQPTPPITPIIDEDHSSSERVITPQLNCSGSPVPEDIHLDDQTVSVPREFSGNLELSYNQGRPIEFGRGAWSIVYKASYCAISSDSPTITPPSSPLLKTRVVAVKSPARRDAHPILAAEALALTLLSLVPDHEHHIVPFHGYIPDSHSIVMSAVPLSLSTYIEEKASLARKHMSTSTMFDPVQGMAEWHGLAKKLISGLSWLHNGPRMIHGDIKPHNILLQPRPTGNDTESDDFPFEALFADFSSAYYMADSCCPMNNTAMALTALTPPFAAPELLSVSALTSPDVAPTPASDVFSLAVTLLAATTGDLLLYPGASSMQRLAMAREGHHVIDFARSGNNGCRVPRNGVVERVVKPAIQKDPAQRIIPSEWVGLVEAVA